MPQVLCEADHQNKIVMALLLCTGPTTSSSNSANSEDGLQCHDADISGMSGFALVICTQIVIYLCKWLNAQIKETQSEWQ